MTGWNLPPGVTDADIERAASCPAECEDCSVVWDDKQEAIVMSRCPYDGDNLACAADRAADEDVDR